MPIEVQLYYPSTPIIKQLLLQHPLIDSLEEDGKLDIYSFALAEDIYGHTLFKESAPVLCFLAQFSNEWVFTTSNLQTKFANKYLENIIGQWHLPFLQWVKFIARHSKSDLSIHYLHERGDFPYETADWQFNYSGKKSVKESFYLQNYDSEDWWASISKMNNGAIFRDGHNC